MEHKQYKKVVLVILDGFGIASPGLGNAVTSVPTLNFDFLVNNFPSLSLQASGPLVGLPWGEMGNSEVGHLNLGAGRIVGQDLPRITTSIQTGEFFKNPAFLEAMEHVKKHNSQLHLMGMVSNGGVHSSDEHLYALLGLAAQERVSRVFIHMFTDGRDTAEKVALESIGKLEEKIGEIGVGQLATIAGRFYALDRGQHWNQTLLVYRALVSGKGLAVHSAEEYVSQNYQSQIYDEMFKPAVIIAGDNSPIATVAENDAVIFFNFRQDRALQLTEMFTNPELVPEEFRQKAIPNLFFVAMTQYKKGLSVKVAFPAPDLENNLAQVVSQNNLTQFHIAESEKYAHITSFFNGGRTEEFPGEERVIVRSPHDNARNYSDSPQMSAPQLADVLVEKITKTEINFFVANFANGDMVGHTGNLEAAKKAVAALDECMGRIYKACLLVDAVLLVTADHGNVEQMLNVKTGEIDKDHTANPVPLLVVANEFKFELEKSWQFVVLSSRTPGGIISDVAPTILDLLGLPKPKEMTGVSLLGSL